MSTIAFCTIYTLVLLSSTFRVIAASNTVLADLTENATSLLANQAELLTNYCPTGGLTCDEDPGKSIGISTIGGIIFVSCVGLAVGTDVTYDSIWIVLKHSKWAFVVGIVAQFGFMPFYAFLSSVVFKSDLESTAFYSYEAAVMGMAIVGCLPGGNTSNLFTWFCGGNVSLSILMSLASNIAAIGMLPLLLHLYYETRFKDAEDAPKVPYLEMLAPMVVTLLFVFVGMAVRARCSPEVVWWTAKISSLFALVFLFAAVLLGIIRYPHVIGHGSYAMYIFCLTVQPAGYLAGWVFATLARCGLRDKLTIAFETGVQSFTSGLVMAELGFNAEKEVCQFDSRCTSLIHGTDTSKYEFAWSADGRVKEGSGAGKITVAGFLPGQAGDRTYGGCCRYNELIFLDVFKFSAMCSIFYAVHAFWMVKLFRKFFPMGFARSKDVWLEERWEPTEKYAKTIFADGRSQPLCPPVGLASATETPLVTVIELLGKATSRCAGEWALAQESPEPYVKGQTLSKPWSKWKRWTWTDYKLDIELTANAFAHSGLEPNGTVVIYGFNMVEWNVSALAAILVGAKACGIYPTDTLEQVVFKVEHSDASVAVIEDNKKLEIFRKGAESMSCLKSIFMYGASPDTSELARKSGPLPVHAWSKISELAAQSQSRYAVPLSGTSTADVQDSMKPSLSPGTPCCIVYTSGTTGMPKGVLLSHDNLCFAARSLVRIGGNKIGVEYSQERILSYLPLSHVAGFLLDIIFPIAVTACTKGFATVYQARPYDLKEGSLRDRLTFVRPTIFLGVPRVWEKFYEGLQAVAFKIQQLTGLRAQMPIICCIRKTAASRWAKAQGLRSARNLQYGGSGYTTAFLGLADAMILSKIRAALGLDACKLAFTGAAPIMLETLQAFGSYGIQVNELYAMSESSAYGTITTDARRLWGSCGFASPGGQLRVFQQTTVQSIDGQQTKTECPRAKNINNPTEAVRKRKSSAPKVHPLLQNCCISESSQAAVPSRKEEFAEKMAEQGEICMRGRHIMMGYLANPKMGDDHVREITTKTNEAIDDEGWLHTGDMGCIGENGFVRVTGRYKELIITSGGENVAPVPIEDGIKKRCPGISNCIMIGDKRKFNTCLVTLKTKDDGQELARDALLVEGVTTVAAARESAEYKAVIQKAIEENNQDSKVCPSNASKVQKFEILPVDFTVEGEELTSTLKLRRNVVQTKYNDFIERFYL